MPSTRTGSCACCGQVGRIHARELISTCYFRIRDRDELGLWPGIVKGSNTHGFCAWCDEYGELASRYMHASCYQIALKLGLHVRYGRMRYLDPLCKGFTARGHHCRLLRNESEDFCALCGGASPWEDPDWRGHYRRRSVRPHRHEEDGNDICENCFKIEGFGDCEICALARQRERQALAVVQHGVRIPGPRPSIMRTWRGVDWTSRTLR